MSRVEVLPHLHEKASILTGYSDCKEDSRLPRCQLLQKAYGRASFGGLL